MTDVSKVTRVEVIDENGRSYTNWNEANIVQLSLQDNQKTLKVFINKRVPPFNKETDKDGRIH